MWWDVYPDSVRNMVRIEQGLINRIKLTSYATVIIKSLP